MSDETRKGATKKDARELAAEAHTDFARAMSYGDYLQLDTLLAAQKPLSDQPDELLFIIIHQATELWMKLVLHELTQARALVVADDLQPAFKAMARVSRIQAQLIQSWDVLSTMTPSDYSSFRSALGQSSGFQSAQYRLIEFLLGNKQAQMIEPHRHLPELATRLDAALATPSLYDEVIRLLARRGFAIDPAALGRDVREPYAADASVRAAWLTVYRDPKAHWELYQLAEELVDLEDWFQQWRFRHVTTVQRVIGFKRGTGGTAGVAYLRKALDIVFFPELWDVRTEL
ncbi:tryptophan 2,3-dioxygenase [Aliidongia dinghuensis]|uniref:Tryptophan 2,3-dioxygenase n=1 Tax=Aliidongia dinghuensis TaxID=1867774 RepID=A0A8J2YPY7_9PROT|nr:tryptophan 2,3-dioxygenase [Aliidongia dinghuensis]GGF02804.1 tryptophan 2,3-dioxygenase [Aliidongia dinghuensis]